VWSAPTQQLAVAALQRALFGHVTGSDVTSRLGCGGLGLAVTHGAPGSVGSAEGPAERTQIFGFLSYEDQQAESGR
jgi:hypothetical protein